MRGRLKRKQTKGVGEKDINEVCGDTKQRCEMKLQSQVRTGPGDSLHDPNRRGERYHLERKVIADGDGGKYKIRTSLC